jgi:hypothetical protein
MGLMGLAGPDKAHFFVIFQCQNFQPDNRPLCCILALSCHLMLLPGKTLLLCAADVRKTDKPAGTTFLAHFFE